MEPPPPYDGLSPPPYQSEENKNDKPSTTYSVPPPPWQPPAAEIGALYEHPQYLPPSLTQQPRRQVNVIVVGSAGPESAAFVSGEQVVADSYLTHVALACTVMCCCNCLFGLVAYVLASMAQSASLLDRARSQRLGRASLKVSVVGIALTLLIGAIVGGVCRNSGECVRGRFFNGVASVPISRGNNCSGFDVHGMCYGSRRRVSNSHMNCRSSFDTCCLSHEDLYYDRYCYTLLINGSGNNNPWTSDRQMKVATEQQRTLAPLTSGGSRRSQVKPTQSIGAELLPSVQVETVTDA